MKIFTIETESNNITWHASTQDAEAVFGAERFTSEAGLAKLAANWPSSRLVEIWNSLPGATPVRKFTDRKKAVTRIWKAIQNLETPEVAKEEVPENPVAVVATPAARQTPDVAPEPGQSQNKGSRSKKSPKGARKPKSAREGSKTDAILRLLKQPGGTTLKAIMEVTTWQAHSVRGFISGTLGKKMGLRVVSTKDDAKGERTYAIKA